MLTSCKRIAGAVLGLTLGLSCALPALADDTEIYVTASTPSPEVRPNILFIVDTSGSMGTDDVLEDRPFYDSGKTYSSQGTNCTNKNIFFRRSGDPLPDCTSTNFIKYDSTVNKCKAMLDALDKVAGRWTGKTAQYDTTAKQWLDLKVSGTSDVVECFADNGKNGDGGGSAKYARNGDASNKWTTNAGATIDWTARTTYTLYSTNWLNWRYTADPDPTKKVKVTRLEAVQDAAIGMTASIDGVNLGLMRYSNNKGDGEQVASGGYVVQAVDDVTANRDSIIKQIDDFAPDGNTPLSETLYEAYRYYAGKRMKFGNTSKPGVSVDAARISAGSTTYKSPIIGECQKSYVVYLTDGLPTTDNEADTQISTLDHGVADACTLSTGQKKGDDGICLDDMAHYMRNHDLSTTVNDTQYVTTHTIGFGNDVKGTDFLKVVADAGGGTAYEAENSEKLTEVLTKITDDVLNTSTTFATASVGVNAFNRTQTRDDLYFALFAPAETLRWDGNLKKYKLAVDKTTDPPSLILTGQDQTTDAINQKDGTFKEDTQSFWSVEKDGNDAAAGGAASRLPTSRNIYTYLGANPKGTAASLVALTTATAADFGAGTTADQLKDTVDFAYGKDASRMGDPLHSQPAVVTYTADTEYVYIATNDGYVHAVDSTTGVEKWAFVPKELLPRLKQLLVNPAVTNRTYGLDGDITVLRFDLNGDGIIDTSTDRVWLYVGMRRGGRSYYALDVTNPAAPPTLMWFDNASDLPGLGETWSAPVITRVDVPGASPAQNSQKLVLVLGGGYDPAQEGNIQVDDPSGNHIYMVDAKSGGLLWYAALTGDKAGTSAQQALRTEFADMKNSIPARMTVIDTNGDLFADRMYVGDMGGRVWRFDIFSGNAPSSLVTGGVFAELGQGGVATPALADTRRFYNAADVSLIQRRGSDPYYNIAIGSGYRGHPLKTDNTDRFYSLRDKQPFTKLDATGYSSLPRLTDSQLVDVTSDMGASVDATSKGWKFVYSANVGEKVLAESTTASDVILVPTYQPDTSQQTITCRPSSKNRVYAFKVDNGGPALDLNRDGKITKDDVSTQVIHEGILGNVNIGVLRGKLADDLKPKTPGPPTVCLAGMHILGQCVQVDDSVRTFWRKDVDPVN